MDSFLADLRYAARGLLRARGTALIAVTALALGIGLTTVMFSIVYGAMHRGLPFEGAERIVGLSLTNPSTGEFNRGATTHDLADWRERQRSLEGLAGFSSGTINVRGTERPERYDGGFLTAGALEVIGVQPLLGRAFTAEDEHPDSPVALLLGYRVWQERFGGDREVLGRSVTVNGELGHVAGVMPEGFEFPENQEVWIPIREDVLATPRGRGRGMAAFGKLLPGVSLEAANAEFGGIAETLAAAYPETNEGTGVLIRPFTETFLGPEERATLYAMLATVALVLLIACANVANLLLARAAMRTRDVAIRSALGASRRRVVVQMMVEALVLAGAGALLGTGLAWVGIGLFARAVAPADPPFWMVFQLDAPILAFVAGISALAAVASGALPALRASATDLNAILKDESRGSSSLHIGRLSRVLVVAEVAMSLALLVASGLMIQSVLRLEGRALPFPSEDVFTARIALFEERFPDRAARGRFWEDVETRVAALPGVRAAGLMVQLPGLGDGAPAVQVDGESYTADRDVPNARVGTVSPGFFTTFDVEALQGRLFTRLDGPDAPPVAVVNESFVRERFTDGQALGRRVRRGGLETESPWLEVVGVVPDLAMEGIDDSDRESPAGLYVPLAQNDANFISLAARADGTPLALSGPVRDAVVAVDADTPIYFVDTLQARIDQDLWFFRVFGGLFAVFGAAALFMASVGLYGVMSFSVSRRVQEMGIRMALGAEGRQVRALILRQGMTQIGVGMLFGSGLAALAAQGLQFIVLGGDPWHVPTFVTVFVVLGLTGLAASAVPAARATRVHPVEALRYE